MPRQAAPSTGRARTKAARPARKSKDEATTATPAKGRKAGRPRATAKAR